MDRGYHVVSNLEAGITEVVHLRVRENGWKGRANVLDGESKDEAHSSIIAKVEHDDSSILAKERVTTV